MAGAYLFLEMSLEVKYFSYLMPLTVFKADRCNVWESVEECLLPASELKANYFSLYVERKYSVIDFCFSRHLECQDINCEVKCFPSHWHTVFCRVQKVIMCLRSLKFKILCTQLVRCELFSNDYIFYM